MIAKLCNKAILSRLGDLCPTFWKGIWANLLDAKQNFISDISRVSVNLFSLFSIWLFSTPTLNVLLLIPQKEESLICTQGHILFHSFARDSSDTDTIIDSYPNLFTRLINSAKMSISELVLVIGLQKLAILSCFSCLIYFNNPM